MSNTKTAPTIEDVVQLQQRYDEMESRAGEIGERLEAINDELAQLLAGGKGDSDKAQELRQERRVLQDEAEELASALPILEAKIREDRESAGRDAAEKEISRLARRATGLRQAQDAKVQDFLAAASALQEAAQALTDNFTGAERSEGEARALAERFSLPEPSFNGPAIPGRIPSVTKSVIDLAALAIPERATQARKYPPREDSTAAEILEFAGPLPEPEPKPSVAARRKREQESRERFRRETAELLASVGG